MRLSASPSEQEVRSIFRGLQAIIQNESYPSWAGDPRHPDRSRFASEPQRPIARAFRPIDEWISRARPFTPQRSHFLADGPHVFFRHHLEEIASKISNAETERDKREVQAIDEFRQSLGNILEALNQLSVFYDPDGRGRTIFHRVGRAGIRSLPDPEIDGEEIVKWVDQRWNEFHNCMQHLLGDKTVKSVLRLREMALDGRETIVFQEGRGARRAFWRHQFVTALAHLWWNIYGSLPGSNSTHPFVDMVESAWHTALECVGEKPVDFWTDAPIVVDPARLRRFENLNWERTTREVVAKMRDDPQYFSKG
jgi:hypothetical protein